MPPKRKSRERENITSPSETPKRYRTNTPAASIPIPLLFQLPREIRDLIYHELWRSKLPFTLIYKTSEFAISYELSSPSHGLRIAMPGLNRNRDSDIPAPWFLTSKQFLDEAMEQFHRGSTWTFLSDRFSQYYTGSKLLLSPWKTHTLDLGSIKICEQAYLLPNERDVATRVEPLHPVIQPLKYRGSGYITSPNLRVLKFELAVQSYAPCKDPQRHIDVDLSAVSSLNLSSLNIANICVSFGRNFEGDDRMRARLKEGIRDLGAVLVNGDVREDYNEEQQTEKFVWCFRFCKV